MPLIPDLNPNVPGRHVPAAPSLGAAMAPGKALQQVGSGVSRVGEEIGAFQLRMQQARDEGVKSRAALAVQQAVAEHEQFRMTNPDESAWQSDIDQRMGRVRETFSGEKLSPMGREALDAQFDGWGQTYRNRTMLDATKQSVARARQALTNEVRARQDAGDFDGAEQRLREAAGSVLLPEEADSDIQSNGKLRDDWRKQQAYQSAIAEIDGDPFLSREKYSAAEAPAGMDPSEWSRLRSYHRSAIARAQGEVVDAINDGIATGKIIRPDQVDEYEDELGAANIAKIKGDIAKIGDANRDAMVKTAPYQARMIGAVSAAIDELDPEDIDSRVRIESYLRDIQPGVSKNELSEELRKKLAGELPDMTSITRAKSLVNMAFRNGYFGGGSISEQTTSDVISDDFLMDGAKLQRLGLPEPDAIMDPEKNETERLREFRRQWVKRDKSKDDPNDYDFRAATAISERRDKVPASDAERVATMRANWSAIQRKGEIERKLSEWAKAHPDGDVEAELMRMLGENDSARFIDALGDGEPWMDDYVPGEEFEPLPGMEPGTGGTAGTILPQKGTIE